MHRFPENLRADYRENVREEWNKKFKSNGNLEEESAGINDQYSLLTAYFEKPLQ